MSAASRAARRIAFGGAWLALFSILYTTGERLGIWPPMPPGAFRDWDLAIGAVSTAALVAALSVSGRAGP